MMTDYKYTHQFNQTSSRFGLSAPANRQEILSMHFSDRNTCLMKDILGFITSSGSMFILGTVPSSPPSPVPPVPPLPKLFGTRTGWVNSEYNRDIREKNMENENKAGRNNANFTNFINIKNLMTTARIRSLSLNKTKSMALMKPSAFNFAIAILISANIPILVTSNDILWLLGWRISAIIGTGLDDCGIGSLYHPTMSPPPPAPHPFPGFL